MASYQDIDSRLRTIEAMTLFIMQSIRMKAVAPSGVVGPDGQPLQGKPFDASLLELYRMASQYNLPTEVAPKALET